MEDSCSVDPLEKIMEELDAINTKPNSPTSQPKELPHRPMILPSEIKVEPVYSRAGSPLNEPIIKSETSQITTSVDGTTLSTLRTAATTSIESNGNEVNEGATSASAQAVNSIEVSSSSTETEHKTYTPNTTSTTPDTQINKEKDAGDGNGELPEDFTTNLQNESHNNASSPVSAEEGEILDIIKSEPVDRSTVIQTTNVTVSSSNQSSGINSAVMQQLERNYLSSVPERSHNTGAVEHEMDETLPDNFFDDLLQEADNITAAALKATPATSDPHETPTDSVEPKIKTEPLDSTNQEEVAQSAPIPENFFDDLLVDHVAERVEDVVNQDLEVKYSIRLKELEELKIVEQQSHKSHKKHKKKKKKSHKRSHPIASDDEESVDSNQKRSKRTSQTSTTTTQSLSKSHRSPSMRIRVKNEFMEIPDSPQRIGSLFPHASAQPFPNRISEPMDIVDLDADEPETSAAAAKRVMLAKSNRIRVKSEFATFPEPIAPQLGIEFDEPDNCLPVREHELYQQRNNCQRNGLVIDMTTPLGFKRIKLEKDVEKPKNNATNFISPSDKIQYAKQRALAAIEEFKKASKEKSGLLSGFLYTTTVRKLPNSSSYYTQQIYENRSPLHNVNNVQYKFNSHANHFNLREWGLEEMPPVATKVAKILGFDAHSLAKKLETVNMPLKLQKIKKEILELQGNEKMVQSKSSFLLTVATQTNDVVVLETEAERHKTAHDIAVQTTPELISAATQTIAVVPNTSSYDNLPLIRRIKTLNENQLMALNDFAELICQPAPSTNVNAIDLVSLRLRLAEIYKFAQLPSELDSASSTMPSRPPRPTAPQITTRPNPPHTRDPRLERRLMRQEPPPPPPRQMRSVHTPQPFVPPQTIPVISSVQSYHPSAALMPPHESLPKPLTYYGRGGLRR